MNPEAVVDRDLSTVSLQSAVFCVNCEVISNSPHDMCAVCGSRSLIGLFRVLGGTLQMRRSLRKAEPKVRYNLELALKAVEITGRDMNQAIESLTRLTAIAGELESLHINVESVENVEAFVEATEEEFLKAA